MLTARCSDTSCWRSGIALLLSGWVLLTASLMTGSDHKCLEGTAASQSREITQKIKPRLFTRKIKGDLSTDVMNTEAHILETGTFAQTTEIHWASHFLLQFPLLLLIVAPHFLQHDFELILVSKQLRQKTRTREPLPGYQCT